ncbi:caspase domain-containing protein [Archangium violaceum]|uniref:caspase domain-containing protein n=1 Tax=Archangium violaceum TaxID=83451 RepID=UPI0037BE8645
MRFLGMALAQADKTMRGHALILGSQTYGLTGVLGDAARMADALGALGFSVLRCVGAEATREGILQGYRSLIETCAPDEAVFVYYAGHGARSPEPEDGFQFIVPVDFERSTEEDFRGITSLELSVLLAELTTKTRNVTVVLDCCFAARMSRGLGLVPRGLPEVPLPVVRAHLARLQAWSSALGGLHVESNPHAVRLVASALDESAYEYTNARGVRTGLLTDAFLEVLEEARGLRVSWGQLGRRVRERVLARCPRQRPELEGPGRRLLFLLEELEQELALPYFPERNRHWLRGGRLHGVHPGDEYAIMPLGTPGPDAGRALALARVVEVQGGASQVELDRRSDSVISTGAPAFLLRSAQPRRAVVLEGLWDASQPFHVHLSEGLQASPFVRQATGDEQGPVLARVRLGEGRVDVLDADEDSVVHPLPLTSHGALEVIRALEVLARAQALCELESAADADWLKGCLDIEWGRVLSGHARRLPSVGACLHAGERLYVRLLNRGRSRIYVSVFDVGVSGCITLLNTSQPSGLVLGPERVETLGARPDGTLVGLELDWPAGVPTTGERPEFLVIIASDAPVDLRMLETPGFRLVRTTALSVQRLLQGLAVGATRAASAQGGSSHRVTHAVRHIRFWLDPRPLR